MRRDDLPLFGPTDLFDDEGVTPDVIVRVDYALSRKQLHAALGSSFAEIAADQAPEDLTVIQVRTEVEGYLSAHGIIAVDQQMADNEHRDFPPAQQRVLQVLAEAVERAYPPRRELPPVQRPVYGGGTVTLDTLDHGRITIDEPSWCTGHDGEQIVQRSDIGHAGAATAGEYAGVEFLPARISWGPFAELQPEPYPVADVEEFPAMTPNELRELAAETARHADRLYRLADDLALLRLGGQS